MTQPSTIDNSSQAISKLTPARALRLAWFCWLGLMVVPFAMILWLIWHLSPGQITEPGAGAQRWFIGSMAYLALAVPASLFWRGRVFKPYWAGQTVPPAQYLSGMATVWAALAVGGIVSLAGCVATKSLTPNLLPAMMSLILFLTMWPGGRAMIRRVGNADDPGLYEEPR